MSGQLSDPTTQLKNVHAFHLLADRNHFYFASQSAENNGAAAMGMASPSNVMTQLGMRTVPVHGYLHAFDQRTSEHAWYVDVKDQHLILDQLEDLPLLFFTAHSAQPPNGGFGGPIARPGMRIAGAWGIAMLSIQKRDARTVFSESFPANTMTNIFGVRVDRRANTVELLSQRMKITYSPKTDDEKKPKPAAAAPASRPKAADTRAIRPALDRARIREIAPPLPPG